MIYIIGTVQKTTYPIDQEYIYRIIVMHMAYNINARGIRKNNPLFDGNLSLHYDEISDQPSELLFHCVDTLSFIRHQSTRQ